MNRRNASIILVGWMLTGCGVSPSSMPSTPGPTATPTPSATSSAPPPSAPPSEAASPSPQPSQAALAACGDVLASTVPTGSFTKSLGVFGSADGLSLYDIEADSVTVIAPVTSQFGIMPRFRTPGLISFVQQREPGDDQHLWGQDSLFELDVQSGQATEILRLPSALLSHEWSPDGALLAYLVQGWSAPDAMPVSLCLLDARAGTTRLLRSLPEWIGRGGNQRDEVSVAWSPDADQVLAVDTPGDPSMFVVDLDGRDVVTPQRGTFARWLSTDRVLASRWLQGTPGWEWVSMTTATGQARRFDLPSEAYRPALSPDGRMIAFDDGNGGRPWIYVFDRDRGATRKLARGAVSPVWLGSGLLAATVTVPCPPTNFCTIPWISADETIGIDVATGESRPLALGTTLQGWATGAIDVLLAGD